MTATVEQSSRWLPLRTPGSTGLPLFCFPHAGAGASAYRSWVGRLPGVEVLPVQAPGREARLREPAYEQLGPMVEELATVVLDAVDGGPYALYGHSLGALVAFETLRKIRRRGATEPAHLIVSGCAAPQCPVEDGPPVTGMSQAELARMLGKLGGTPAWLLSDPELLQMILPAVRADFSVKETYRYVEQAPISVPLTVLASTADPRAAHHLQERWRELTAAEFRLHTLTGGHFAVLEQHERTHQHLGHALAAALGATAG